MKKSFASVLLAAAFVAVALTGCEKAESIGPEKTVDHEIPKGQKPEGGQEQLRLRVQAVIMVGNVVYDNIPAGLTIISWDSAQVATERYQQLAPGVNEIILPPAAVKYRLTSNKWGVTTDTLINAASLPYTGIVQLKGAKAAKLLKREDRTMQVQGVWVPDGRVEYSYYNGNVLSSVLYFSKTTQQPELVASREDIFVYRNGRLTRINHLGDAGAFESAHEFTYDNGKDISFIRETRADGTTHTSADVTYQPATSQVRFSYRYFNGNTMSYTQKYSDGNLTEEAATSSRGTGESGKYKFDYNINPYAQLNYPDVFLSRRSKNNKIEEARSYSGDIPMTVAYKYEYTYDADGYPIELQVSYKGYSSNEHLFIIKTIYTYY